METKILKVATVNQVVIVINDDENQLVPIKPICEALGIDAKAQRDRINRDEILSSVGVMTTSTGSDGKQYEMVNLPLKFVFGWLFTINPKNAKAAQPLRWRTCECRTSAYLARIHQASRKRKP